MALANTGIYITTVQSAIGFHSADYIGPLVASAYSGGVAGYAFYLYETRANNANRYDGVLIFGAKPFWNIYSGSIPAEWFNDNGMLNLRLKRDPGNVNGGYVMWLQDFRGYDHEAVKPAISAPTTVYKPQGNATVTFQIRLHQVVIDSTHVLVQVKIGTQTKTVLLPKSAINEAATITHYDVAFTNVATESAGTIKAFGSTDAGTELVDLQMLFGIHTFELSENPYVEVVTTVNSSTSLTVQATMYKGYGAEKVVWENDRGANIVITGVISWYQTVNSDGHPTSSPINVLPACTPEPFTVTIPVGFSSGFRGITIGDPSEVTGTQLYACMNESTITPAPSEDLYTISYKASKYTY